MPTQLWETKCSQVINYHYKLNDNKLEQGDGESEPHTPPSELQEESHADPGSVQGRARSRSRSLTHEDDTTFGEISFRLDVVAISIFVLAAATRFYNLAYPHSIV